VQSGRAFVDITSGVWAFVDITSGVWAFVDITSGVWAFVDITSGVWAVVDITQERYVEPGSTGAALLKSAGYYNKEAFGFAPRDEKAGDIPVELEQVPLPNDWLKGAPSPPPATPLPPANMQTEHVVLLLWRDEHYDRDDDDEFNHMMTWCVCLLTRVSSVGPPSTLIFVVACSSRELSEPTAVPVPKRRYVNQQSKCRSTCHLTDDKSLLGVGAAHAVLFSHSQMEKDTCGGKCLPPTHNVPWVYVNSMTPNATRDLEWLPADWTATWDWHSDVPATRGLNNVGFWPRHPTTVSSFYKQAAEAHSSKSNLAVFAMDRCFPKDRIQWGRSLGGYLQAKILGACHASYTDPRSTAVCALSSAVISLRCRSLLQSSGYLCYRQQENLKGRARAGWAAAASGGVQPFQVQLPPTQARARLPSVWFASRGSCEGGQGCHRRQRVVPGQTRG
jgi:hypothetical protein